MREVADAVMGMKLSKALTYLGDVLDHKQVIPYTVFTGGGGRHAQGKLRGCSGDKGRWPQKATKIMIDLLKNAEANAEMKGLDTENLYVTHSQANRAQKQRRRTYRAHGRTNPYMSSPCHIEMILSEKTAPVAKGEEEDGKKPKKLSKKRLAQQRAVVAAK